MKKYTDEQLSRILSQSAAGLLGAPSSIGPMACIEQSANDTWQMCNYGYAQERSKNFDKLRYWDSKLFKQIVHDPDSILAWIESIGAA